MCGSISGMDRFQGDTRSSQKWLIFELDLEMHQVNKVESSDLVLEAACALANHPEWYIMSTRKLQGHTEPQREKVGAK